MIEKTNAVAKDVAKRLKDDGYKTKAVSGFGGKFIDGKQYGPFSMKHAAEIAGLGTIGRNMLLISPEYGTLLWFSAVLTDAELTPDKRVQFDICNDCNECVEACPIKALDDPASIKKIECGRNIFKMAEGKWEVVCYACRTVCPYCFGINSR
jgi:epoxyqueuosine reductase QueG